MKKIILFCILFSVQASYSQTVSSLWNEYKVNPYNHPNIPNNSYAGYGTGIVSIPKPSSTPVNVTSSPYNAIPNDAFDDQPAIQSAINAVGTAGGGVVYLPPGNYFLTKPLVIKYNNVILRGAGSSGVNASVLDFRFSVYSAYKKDLDSSGQKEWVWWSTGLVWIGAGDAFKSNGAPDMFNRNRCEEWRSTKTLANVTQPSKVGDFFITVDNTSQLSVGMKVLLCYQMPSDRSFIKHVYGHSPTEPGIDSNKYVDDCSDIKAPLQGNYYWPALIKSIYGKVVTFDRPLRLKVDPAIWPVTIRNIKSMVTESGVENVQIKGYSTPEMAHLPTPTSSKTGGSQTLGGWNGVYINRSWNCWINNVRFVNLECGVILAAAKNCSVLNTFVTSSDHTHWYHHPYAIRVFSSDNLIEDFTIDGPASVKHGINAEWFSSGNVYSRGLMKAGTFDTHRGVPFDLIRTEITVANDQAASSGGATVSGPFAGKRFVHWNVVQKIQPGYVYENSAGRNGNDVFEPLQYPMGALIAIKGPKDKSVGERVPPPLPGGTLGSIVITDSIPDTSLANLYHAQLTLRKQILSTPNKSPVVSITSPSNNSTFNAPATITLRATATDPDGIVAIVRFYSGSTNLRTDYTSPYTCTLSNLSVGAYSFIAQATDNYGKSVKSAPVNIIVTSNTSTATINNAAHATGNIEMMRTVDFISIDKIRGKEKIFLHDRTLLNVPTYNSVMKKPASLTEAFNLRLNPNPVAHTLTISFNNVQINEPLTISVLSASGGMIKTLQIKAANNIKLNVSSLSGGMYFIGAKHGNKTAIREFVKL